MTGEGSSQDSPSPAHAPRKQGARYTLEDSWSRARLYSRSSQTKRNPRGFLECRRPARRTPSPAAASARAATALAVAASTAVAASATASANTSLAEEEGEEGEEEDAPTRPLQQLPGDYRLRGSRIAIYVCLILRLSEALERRSAAATLREAANQLSNKLSHAQHLDEVTWTTKNWHGLQMQRLSVVLHRRGVADGERASVRGERHCAGPLARSSRPPSLAARLLN